MGDSPSSPNGQGGSPWSWLAALTLLEHAVGKTAVSALNTCLFSFAGPSLAALSREPGFLGQVPCTPLVSKPLPSAS